jgi:hypothetical protein
MGEGDVRRTVEDRLPWYYKLILKIPGTDVLENVSSGLFWAMVVPIFLLVEFFFTLFAVVSFPFPTNIGVASVIPVAVFLVFLRISLQRFINWWGANVNDAPEWNIDKTMPEYIKLLKKKKEENN